MKISMTLQNPEKEKSKLISALEHTDKLTYLLYDNQYHQYLNHRLVEIKVELKRQLSHYE